MLVKNFVPNTYSYINTEYLNLVPNRHLPQFFGQQFFEYFLFTQSPLIGRAMPSGPPRITTFCHRGPAFRPSVHRHSVPLELGSQAHSVLLLLL